MSHPTSVNPPLYQAESSLMCEHQAAADSAITQQSVSKNAIDAFISDSLSSADELDFIWVPNVETSLLNNTQGYYSPTEGATALFMHSNGTNLCIKGHPFETGKIAKRIMTLNGYSIRDKEPIILSACYAGNGGEQSMAQHFANALQRVVVASSGLIHIKTSDDKMVLTSIYSDQPFETFRPLPSYFTF